MRSTSLPNTWCVDTDGVPRFVGAYSAGNVTQVTRYNHAGFKQCLAGKKVVFIGDSRVRYQYMHLSHFLLEGRRMKCQDYSTEPDKGCYLIDERAAGSWNEWYKNSTAMIEEGGHVPQSLCDCYRPATFNHPDQSYENRFVRLSRGNIELVYLQNFVNKVRLGEAYPPFSPFATNANSSMSDRCTPGECHGGNRKDVFDGDTNRTLWEILPLLNATDVFVNLGWVHLFPLGSQSTFTCEMEKFMRAHLNMKLTLISHPPNRIKLNEDVTQWFDWSSKLECKVGVLDRTFMNFGVPSSWYWDDLHQLSILNEEYNHRLIELMCPL